MKNGCSGIAKTASTFASVFEVFCVLFSTGNSKMMTEILQETRAMVLDLSHIARGIKY